MHIDIDFFEVGDNVCDWVKGGTGVPIIGDVFQYYLIDRIGEQLQISCTSIKT